MAKRKIIISCAVTVGIRSSSSARHQLITVEGTATAVHETREMLSLSGADKVEF